MTERNSHKKQSDNNKKWIITNKVSNDIKQIIQNQKLCTASELYTVHFIVSMEWEINEVIIQGRYSKFIRIEEKLSFLSKKFSIKMFQGALKSETLDDIILDVLVTSTLSWKIH